MTPPNPNDIEQRIAALADEALDLPAHEALARFNALARELAEEMDKLKARLTLRKSYELLNKAPSPEILADWEAAQKHLDAMVETQKALAEARTIWQERLNELN